jgi:hypothetical protein
MQNGGFLPSVVVQYVDELEANRRHMQQVCEGHLS